MEILTLNFIEVKLFSACLFGVTCA